MQLVRDLHSFANIDEVVTKHLHLDLAVDFAAKALHGHVVLRMHTVCDNVSEVVVDSRNLVIESVCSESDGQSLEVLLVWLLIR